MLHGARRIVLIAVSMIAIPLATPIATASVALPVVEHPSADQPPLAKRGDRSATVKKLQQLLIKSGLSLSGGADGVFGAATENALKKFQTRWGLTVTGVLDVPTATVLGMVSATPALSKGASGDAVRVVQQQLVSLGFTLKGGVDGVYGTATVATVKLFQKSRGITATGALDAATAQILANAAAATASSAPPTTTPGPVPPPTSAPPTTAPPTTAPPAAAPPTTTPAPGGDLAVGSRGDAVKVMQQQLIAVGIPMFGGADGIFGSATKNSLKQFQTRAGLAATGIFDATTKAALEAAAAGAPPSTTPAPPTAVVLGAFPVAASCAFIDTFGAPRAGGRKHEGVDIMVGSGTPVYAVVDGTITKKQLHYVGSLGGNSLWLSAPNRTYFFYAHLLDFAPGIEVGTAVTAGTLIGYVGATGNASVAHLHFEVHPGGGRAVNPYPIVKAVTTCK